MHLLTSFQRRVILFLAIASLLVLVSCGTNTQLPQENPLENPKDDTNNDTGGDTGGDDSGGDDNGGDDTPAPETQVVTVTYQKDSSDFPNPERGMFWKMRSDSARPVALDAWFFRTVKAQNNTVVLRLYDFTTFRNGPISQSFLNHIQSDMSSVRTNGMKMGLRFNYGVNGDAPLNVVLNHINQLSSLFRNNADVIAYVEAGFIGRWGEWHSSTNGLTSVTNKRKILEALLAAVPKERAVLVRYSKDKKDIFSTTSAITSSIAFNGTNRSRTGHHNDCFLSASDDSGTYAWPPTTFEAQKNFLSQENLFLPQVGETCVYNPPRTNCPTAMTELQQMRWNGLHSQFNTTALNAWKSQGCYSEIVKRLGYRYRLLDAVLPQEHTRGTTMTVKVRMTNEGFAGIYNSRKLELVIRNRSTNAVTRYNINPGTDMRLFLPGPGTTKTLTLNASIASTLAKGTYDLFLNMPDPASSLYSRSIYSIRLANTNMWEASTGFNKLGSFTMR